MNTREIKRMMVLAEIARRSVKAETLRADWAVAAMMLRAGRTK